MNIPQVTGKARLQMNLTAAQALASAVEGRLKLATQYDVVCRDRHGNFKWRDSIYNTVTDVGVNDVLDQYFGGTGKSFFIVLIDGTPTVAVTDTMASHAGWTEVTAYDEATRQAVGLAAASAKARTNSASPPTFTISTNSTTVGGCVLASSSTKSETASVLYGGGPFTTGDKSLDDNDTLDVTVTVSGASA